MEKDNHQPTNGGYIVNCGATGIEGDKLVFPPETAYTKKGIEAGEQTLSIKLVDNRELDADRENA